MRYLIAILIVLVISIVAMVLIGAILPKHHVATRTAEFAVPPDRIFALIAGPQDWRTDLKEYKFFDEGGRHFERETDSHGQRITYEITQSQPPVFLKRTIADKNLPFGGSWTWNIQPTSEGCSVTITEDGEVYNPVFRFVSTVLIGHTRTINNYLKMLQSAAGKPP